MPMEPIGIVALCARRNPSFGVFHSVPLEQEEKKVQGVGSDEASPDG